KAQSAAAPAKKPKKSSNATPRAEQILAASKASIAPPPRHKAAGAAGGSFASADVPVRSRRTKSDTPETSDDSEKEDKMEIEDDIEKNEEEAELVAGSGVVENQKEKGAELDVGSDSDIQVEDSKDDDIEMHDSPSPQPAHGSSRSSGGILCGHRDTHRFADMQEDIDTVPGVAAKGRVLIYTTSKNPANYEPEDEKPTAVVDIPCLLSLGEVIRAIEVKYPKICMKTSARGLAVIISVWEDGYWLAKGTYESAQEDDEEAEWDTDGRQPTLRILQSDYEVGADSIPDAPESALPFHLGHPRSRSSTPGARSFSTGSCGATPGSRAGTPSSTSGVVAATSSLVISSTADDAAREEELVNLLSIPRDPLLDKSRGSLQVCFQRWETIQTAHQVWKAKKKDGTWPSTLQITELEINGLLFGKSMYHRYNTVFKKLVDAKSEYTEWHIQQHQRMQAWLRETANAPPSLSLWEGITKGTKESYSLAKLEEWMGLIDKKARKKAKKSQSTV
ncbi:hypothetical protein EST38_g12327, partial [Candolleomyces aberdarensis]